MLKRAFGKHELTKLKRCISNVEFIEMNKVVPKVYFFVFVHTRKYM